MTQITIIGDVHLGLNRTSHTTTASRERLRRALFERITGKLLDYPVFQLGDLFDTFWCDAETLRQGQVLLEKIDVCLIGNHDVSNRVNSSSALEFLFPFSYKDWYPENYASVEVIQKTYDFPVQRINHKLTQELFDKSIDMVDPYGGILLLHCNVASGYSTDESSLNVTQAQLEHLLTKVDKIFIGHEHNPRELFDGRVIITGNVHPTSFSDISDKYLYRVDSDLTVRKELIWDARRNYLKFDYKSLFEPIVLDGYEFLEITGVAEQSELPAIAREIANLWKKLPDIFMIKNSVTCNKVDVAKDKIEVNLTDTLTQITTELSGTKLESVWKQYLDQVKK